jgi:hypothetical protein
MPQISISNRTLHVGLSPAERFWSFSGSWDIPFEHITSARIDDNVRKIIGWRGAGTGTLNFGAGTFIKNGQRQFVFINVKKQTAVVVELSGEKIHRLILGIPGGRPAAESLVAQLNQR